MLSVTFIADTAYCTKYAYLLHIRKIPPSREVHLGTLRHKCYEQLSTLERSAELKTLPKKEVEQLLKEAIEKTIHSQGSALLAAGYTLEQAKAEIELAFKQRIAQTAKNIASQAPPQRTLLEKSLKSEKLGVRGRVDKIVFAETTYPVEFKGWSERLKRDSIQLAGYALLIEENYHTQVGRGVIEYLHRQAEVLITSELRSEFLTFKKTADAIKLGFAPTANCKECERNCHYREIGM